MKNKAKIIWGIIFIVVGVLFALNWIFNLNINVFFDGWWTLFIIVPCTIGLFTKNEKTGNVIGICVGVILLLWQQKILDWDIIWKIIVAAVIILIGFKLIFSYFFDSKNSDKIKELRARTLTPLNVTASFSSQDLNFNGQVFDGAEFGAFFGSIKCDLSGALINGDCVIVVSAIFGGVELIMPDNVNVKAKSNSLFGGVSDKTKKAADEGAPTVYIEATCVFGGVEIK